MIQPGMMFGGEGPIMQGTWYNPQTGDAFTVRDSFFEDNQYTITTTDGRYLRYDQIQNYVQTDMKLEELKNSKIATVKKEEDPIPAEVSSLIASNDELSINDMLLPEDMDIITGASRPKLGNIYNTSNTPENNNMNTTQNSLTYVKEAAPESVNRTIIKKALSNAAQPKIVVNIDWDFPTKEMEMLKDIMQISENEIVDYYLDTIQLNDVIECLQNCIKQHITLNGNKDSVEPILTAEDVKKNYIAPISERESTKNDKANKGVKSRKTTNKKA